MQPDNIYILSGCIYISDKLIDFYVRILNILLRYVEPQMTKTDRNGE